MANDTMWLKLIVFLDKTGLQYQHYVGGPPPPSRPSPVVNPGPRSLPGSSLHYLCSTGWKIHACWGTTSRITITWTVLHSGCGVLSGPVVARMSEAKATLLIYFYYKPDHRKENRLILYFKQICFIHFKKSVGLYFDEMCCLLYRIILKSTAPLFTTTANIGFYKQFTWIQHRDFQILKIFLSLPKYVYCKRWIREWVKIEK